MSRATGDEVRPQSDVDLGRFDRNPPEIGLVALLKEDLATHDGEWLSEGFIAVAVHRLGNARLSARPRLLRAALYPIYVVLHKLVQTFCGIDLPYTSELGRRVRIWHRGGMIISAIRIGDDTHLRQNTTMGVRRRGDPRWLRPTIGKRCDIGAGAVIVGGVTIGDDCVIGANVVVAEDVPAGSIVTVPKPVIRSRRDPTA